MNKLDKVYNYTVTFTLAVEVSAVDEHDAVNKARWYAMNNGAEYEDHKISLQGLASVVDAADYHADKWVMEEEGWAAENGYLFAPDGYVWYRPDGSTCKDIYQDFLRFVLMCQSENMWDERDNAPRDMLAELNSRLAE
jgi:hypothetical protein